MKSLSLLLGLMLLGSQSSAAEVVCNGVGRKAKFSVKVAPGEMVKVTAMEFGGSAYVWHPSEELPMTVETGSGEGALRVRTFTIVSDQQVNKTKRYIFRLALAWEDVVRNREGVLATCSVLVSK